jgi:hypothetical protein
MKPGWGWIAIAAALVVVVLAVSAWETERSSPQPNPTPPPPAGKPLQDAAKPEPKTPATAQLPRERPERGRVDRP